jgi:hypothetical protein
MPPRLGLSANEEPFRSLQLIKKSAMHSNIWTSAKDSPTAAAVVGFGTLPLADSSLCLPPSICLRLCGTERLWFSDLLTLFFDLCSEFDGEACAYSLDLLYLVVVFHTSSTTSPFPATDIFQNASYTITEECYGAYDSGDWLTISIYYDQVPVSNIPKGYQHLSWSTFVPLVT